MSHQWYTIQISWLFFFIAFKEERKETVKEEKHQVSCQTPHNNNIADWSWSAAPVQCHVNIVLLPALCQQITKYVGAWICVWIQSVTYFGAGRGHDATIASCSSSWFWVSRNWLFIPHPPRVEFIQDFQSSGFRSLHIYRSPEDGGLGTTDCVPILYCTQTVYSLYCKLNFTLIG